MSHQTFHDLFHIRHCLESMWLLLFRLLCSSATEQYERRAQDQKPDNRHDILLTIFPTAAMASRTGIVPALGALRPRMIKAFINIES